SLSPTTNFPQHRPSLHQTNNYPTTHFQPSPKAIPILGGKVVVCWNGYRENSWRCRYQRRVVSGRKGGVGEEWCWGKRRVMLGKGVVGEEWCLKEWCRKEWCFERVVSGKDGVGKGLSDR
ncbi:16930_t:CDS:2, partial [Dentiscutata heterogama]